MINAKILILFLQFFCSFYDNHNHLDKPQFYSDNYYTAHFKSLVFMKGTH